MATLVQAKIVKGKKVWYVWGAEGNDKWERQYPQCRARGELYDILRREIGLPATSSRTDVVFTLMNKTWTGTQWVDDFTIRLKELRENAGITQVELARKAGLSMQAIAALEQGTRGPSWDTLLRLADALKIRPENFKINLPSDLPKPVKPKEVFRTAWGFSQTARILIERYRKQDGHHFIAPLAVNSALAVELYLKCLLLLEGKSYAPVHDLKSLFDSVDTDDKERIKQFFTEDIARKEYIKRIQASNPEMRYEVEPILEAANKAFEEWRYIFEEKDYTRYYYGLEEVREAVERIILEIKPEWGRTLCCARVS
jgi:transcriptional regulator with XRE-family HTH domain